MKDIPFKGTIRDLKQRRFLALFTGFKRPQPMVGAPGPAYSIMFAMAPLGQLRTSSGPVMGQYS